MTGQQVKSSNTVPTNSMKNDLFAIPVRKYHIDETETFLVWAKDEYLSDKFEDDGVYQKWINRMPAGFMEHYTDVIEQFLRDINVYDTHCGVITNITLRVLESGDSFDRESTLPSHYTFTHYIDTDTSKPDDIYYHPLNAILRAFDPGVDIPEWQNAGGVYTTAGDVVIYPSYLEQSTPKMTGPGTRITITCTFNLEPYKNDQGGGAGTEESTPG